MQLGMSEDGKNVLVSLQRVGQGGFILVLSSQQSIAGRRNLMGLMM